MCFEPSIDGEQFAFALRVEFGTYLSVLRLFADGSSPEASFASPMNAANCKQIYQIVGVMVSKQPCVALAWDVLTS